MKPFNLKEALEGKPVVTRDNLPVTQLTLFETDNIYSLRAVVERCVCDFTTGGVFDIDVSDHKYNLFMATEKKSIWVNVYEVMDSLSEEFELSIGKIHGTKESALRAKNKHYIKTIEITNEIEL